jgi:BASS family bile acid:Na+ symporter
LQLIATLCAVRSGAYLMDSHQLINALVTITLVEMMVAIGLAVSLDDVIAAARDGRRVVRIVTANYLVVPAVTLLLVEWLVDSESLAVGLFILAVFPGSSYGPPFTAFARADVPLSVGMMVLLAASSAIVGPVLLRQLLQLTSVNTSRTFDFLPVIGFLGLLQLLPLVAGIAIRRFRPNAAARLRGPAELFSKILNAVSMTCILVTHWRHAVQLDRAGFLAMLILLAASLAAGFLTGGPEPTSRKAMALTTSLRNVGVGVVIASSRAFEPAVLTTVISYVIVEMIGSLLLALYWGRRRLGSGRPSLSAPLS